MILFSPFTKYQKRLSEMNHRKYELRAESNERVLPGSELDTFISEIDSFIENDYANAVFQYFAKKQPDLIRIKTGEVVSWDDAFGTDFDNVTKSLRHSLVGLVEGDGRYKLK